MMAMMATIFRALIANIINFHRDFWFSRSPMRMAPSCTLLARSR
jgi:hypothetical protein